MHPRGARALSIIFIRLFNSSILGVLNHSKKKSYSPSFSPDLLMILSRLSGPMSFFSGMKYSIVFAALVVGPDSGLPPPRSSEYSCWIRGFIMQTVGTSMASFSSTFMAS